MNKTSIICVYVIILTTHNNPGYNYTKEFLEVTFRALALRQSDSYFYIFLVNIFISIFIYYDYFFLNFFYLFFIIFLVFTIYVRFNF